MRKAAAALLAAAPVAAGLWAQEAAVSRDAIWIDTVKRGEMPLMVRGPGNLHDNRTAELKIPELFANAVQPGQPVSVDTRQGVVPGKVARVDGAVANGVFIVMVVLEGTLPEAARPGMEVDRTIEISRLTDVAYVGRPVRGAAESEGVLFRVEPDGRHATRVRVQYGRSSVNQIEIRSGLVAGDRVILSDMSAYSGRDRVRLQ